MMLSPSDMNGNLLKLPQSASVEKILLSDILFLAIEEVIQPSDSFSPYSSLL